MASVPICVPVQSIENFWRDLHLRMPGGIEFAAVRDSIRKLPDPSEAVGKFMGTIDQALAFLAPVAAALELIQALINCSRAAKDAVEQLSTDPIVDCLQGLDAIIAKALAYFPPIPYLRLIGDMCRVLVIYCDEVIRALMEIDARITMTNLTYQRAAALNDARLTAIADCAQSDTNAARAQLLGGLESLLRITGVLVSFYNLFASSGDSAEAKRRAQSQRDSLNAARASASMPIHDIARTVGDARQVLNAIYRFTTQPIGEFVELGPPPTALFVNA